MEIKEHTDLDQVLNVVLSKGDTVGALTLLEKTAESAASGSIKERCKAILEEFSVMKNSNTQANYPEYFDLHWDKRNGQQEKRNSMLGDDDFQILQTALFTTKIKFQAFAQYAKQQ